VSSSSAVEFGATAKLNLHLEVLARRPDGYHEIDTVMVEIDLADRIRLEPADRISLRVEGAGDVPADETNLAWRAAAALEVGARIRLEKRIPPGSGLGGGSSDAAAVLRGLDRLYGLGLGREGLEPIARGLGADVPFFLYGGLARCGGIGERVEPLESDRNRAFLLVLPDLVIPTAAVYGALGSGLTGPRQKANVRSRRYFGKTGPGGACFNRLQAAAERYEPRLREVRREAETRFGRVFTLSGSGSCYFAEMERTGPQEAFRTPGGLLVKTLTVTTIETGLGARGNL